MMQSFLALVRRDLHLAVREGGAVGTALGFYLIVVTMLPLGLGPDLDIHAIPRLCGPRLARRAPRG